MVQERLSDLAIISIERDLCENIDYNDIIEKFAEIKARKINFYASSMGLSGITLVLLSTSESLVILLKSDEVEEIMLQVSTRVTSAKSDGDNSVKVPIREGSLKIPTPTL